MASDPAPAVAPRTPSRPRRLPQLAIIGLALLAVPRVVLHDLGLLTAGTLVNLLLVVVPVAIWIAVARLRRVERPFITLLMIGGWYGVFLAIGHQLLWEAAYAGAPPQLGGALSATDPLLESVIVRTFAAGSSLLTGLAVGAAGGAIAWMVAAARRPSD